MLASSYTGKGTLGSKKAQRVHSAFPLFLREKLANDYWNMGKSGISIWGNSKNTINFRSVPILCTLKLGSEECK